MQIELIPINVWDSKDSDERIKFILGNVKKDKILVLESTLTSEEEKDLIQKTMLSVTKEFSGIEIASLGKGAMDDLRLRLIKMLGGKAGGMTVIGPSHLVKEIKRDPDKLSLFMQKR